MNAPMMYGAKAYAQVGLETEVNSASPHGLIIMLYDGAIQAIRKSKIYLEMNDLEQKGISISKAMKIISDGLAAAVDVKSGGQLAEQLLSLYDYMCKELVLSNLHNDVQKMDHCIALLEDLRSAWSEIGNAT